MVKIKNWNKFAHSSLGGTDIHFRNIKSNQDIFIQKDVYGYAIIVVGKGREYAETQNDALKYATNYMRGHPNG